MLLLVGAVLTHCLTDLQFSRAPAQVRLFEGYFLASRVLAPAGAILIATSLPIRALNRPDTSPSARAQLIAGPTLLAVGLLQLFFGPKILTAITDLLGVTANAVTFIADLLALVLGLTACRWESPCLPPSP